MDEDIRATIVNEIAYLRWCIDQGTLEDVDIPYWEGYIKALEWVLLTIDKDAVDEDPVLTSEEME